MAPQAGENWGVNDVCLWPEMNITRIFEIHNISHVRDKKKESKAKIREYAAKTGTPVVTMEDYPLDAVIDKFKIDYFGSSIDYMLALALFEGFTDFHLYGINMELEKEYAYQKPSGDFWLGYIMGMGGKVKIYGKFSALLKTKVKKWQGEQFTEHEDLIYGFLRKRINA